MADTRIIVACASAELLAAITRHLKARGFDAADAQDSASLAQRIQAGKPGLFIIDFALPGGDGPTVYERFQGNTRLMDVPIIFLVNIPVDEARKMIPASAKVGFLKKPVDLALLDTIVNKLLGPRKPQAARPAFTGEPDDSGDDPTVLDLDS
ncbi:MAG: response regulator [Elusimicrobia bacterium]|nr:response regulator [Elusimicrobiota bacterium]